MMFDSEKGEIRQIPSAPGLGKCGNSVKCELPETRNGILEVSAKVETARKGPFLENYPEKCKSVNFPESILSGSKL